MKKIALVIMLALGVSASVFAESQSTTEVWEHHIQAWQARDINAIVADYNEESVLILNSKIFKGTAAIRKAFTQLFEIFKGGENVVDNPVIVDRIVYITWTYVPVGDALYDGTDTFVIENGKITVQTIASTLYKFYPVNR